jgi:hypothetical protein
MSSKLMGLAGLVAVPFLVFACVVDNGPSSGDGYGYSGSGGTTSTGYPSADGGAPSAHPMTVAIDTNQTMSAAPGQGVGVFVTYDTGGNWNVWWTCDTDVDTSNPPCAFDVKITAQSGAITNVVPQKLEGTDAITQTSAASVEGITTTTTGTDGLTFTTEPGAKILLSATVGGQYDGRFIFFVEQGQIRDSYTGTVTDPIYMTGSAP